MLDGINYWEELRDSLSQMDSITSASSQTLIMHWNAKRGSACAARDRPAARTPSAAATSARNAWAVSHGTSPSSSNVVILL